MDKKILILLTALCCSVTLILIILVIVLPITRQKDAEKDTKEASTPKKDNTDLWANFPGQLKTQTNHTFTILNYSDDRTNASIKDSIKLSESTKYANFEYSDKITFDAISEYSIFLGKSPEKNQKINTLSLGLFETLETLSNPGKYQKGINSIEHLKRKAFQSPETFIKHLYSYYLYKNLNSDAIKANILKDVDPNKQGKIINGDPEFSLNSAKGFDNWVKILGNNKEINEAEWLINIFNLTKTEINSIFGEKDYLYTNCEVFNANLSKEFKCKNSNICGIEIVYNQLITGEVVKYVDSSMNTLAELYNKININFYPFEKSPELFKFFEQYKNEHQEAKEYKEYQLSVEQLEKLIDDKSPQSLLSSNNSIYFISKIDTKDFNTLVDKYGINENELSFINEYIFNFLPELLLYPSFKNGEETLKVTPFEKAYANMASDMIKKTFYPLSKLKNVYYTVLNRLFWNEFKKASNSEQMEYDEEDLCYFIMQQVLDDGRKALKICSDPVTSFKSFTEMWKWYEPYSCVILNNTDCDMTVINRLKYLVYITDAEIKSIYTTNSFGDILYRTFKEFNDSIKCGDKCLDDNYLIKQQYWNSYVSKHLPKGRESLTLSELLPDLIPYPTELQYYFDKKKITEEIPEEAIDYLISLNPAKSDDYLNEENYEAFNKRIQFEKDFSLYVNGKTNDKKDAFHLFDLLNNIFIFNDIVNIQYDTIGDVLQGNNKEDKTFLDYLSNGEYYNNHKPGLNQTTGFNFGINLNNGESIYVPYDKYAIDTNTLRKIVSINNSTYINIKKVEYDHICNKYIYVEEPILNYQSLTGDKSFIDGFEYNHEDDTIYYFDKISSRPYKFIFNKKVDYEDQTCRKYELDVKEYEPKTASISEKLNKPLFISIGKNGLDAEINGEIKEENYICVEPLSNMVLESKINLVYSLYTKKYGFLYPKIENEKNFPIFIYNKDYKVDIDSFNEAFPQINSAKNFKKVFLIVGIIFIVILTGLSAFLIYKILHHKRERITLGPDAPDMNLINDSREATLNRYTENE